MEKDLSKKLALFEPELILKNELKPIDILVLKSLHTTDNLFIGLMEIKRVIKDIFSVEIELAEINESLRNLQKNKLVMFEIDEQTNQITQAKLEHSQLEIMNDESRKILKLEEDVKEEWEKYLLEQYKKYSEITNNISIFWDNLKIVLSNIFQTPGVECIKLLYPDRFQDINLFSKSGRNLYKNIYTKNAFVDSICKLEIQKFLTNPEGKKQKYLSNLFNNSFIFHLIQIEQDTAELFSKTIEPQVLILDNNIIQGLMGLDGPEILHSIHTLINLANKLNYELRVSTKTIDEVYASLENKKQKYTPRIISDVQIVHSVQYILGETHFLTQYYLMYLKVGISLDEYILMKKQLDEILDKLGITITKGFRNDIDKSDELKDETSKLMTHFNSNIHIAEHDAFHYLLISKLRGGNQYNFHKTKYWFLTNDNKLLPYDEFTKKQKKSMPFCIMLNQWIQIHRPLFLRTLGEKDQPFTNLIVTPFLRSLINEFNLEDSYLTILDKIKKYEAMSTELAIKVISDRRLVTVVKNNIDVDKNPEPLIEDKIISEAKSAVEEASGLKLELIKKNMIVKILIFAIVVLLLIPVNFLIIDHFKINTVKSILLILTQLPVSLLIVFKNRWTLVSIAATFLAAFIASYLF